MLVISLVLVFLLKQAVFLFIRFRLMNHRNQDDDFVKVILKCKMKTIFYFVVLFFSCNITVLSELKFEIELLIVESELLLVPQHYSTIQAAINSASANDTILVDPGT